MLRRLGVSAALVDGVLLAGDVEVDEDLVTRVGLPPAAGGRLAVPGYVDLQVNGFAGVDVMDADVDGIAEISSALPSYGVTSWLPTLVTADPARMGKALGVLAEAVDHPAPGGARPLGVHLEGPFLSPERLGTHPAEHRREPDALLMLRWRELGPVVAVTLAPERPGAHALVTALARDGVLVSLGHSDATAAEAHAAFDLGARSVTHLFNAMSPLRQRAPGLPGAALAAGTSRSRWSSTATTSPTTSSGWCSRRPPDASRWSPTRRAQPAGVTVPPRSRACRCRWSTGRCVTLAATWPGAR